MKSTIEPRRYIVPPSRVLESCHSMMPMDSSCTKPELILLHFISSLAYQGCGTVLVPYLSPYLSCVRILSKSGNHWIWLWKSSSFMEIDGINPFQLPNRPLAITAAVGQTLLFIPWAFASPITNPLRVMSCPVIAFRRWVSLHSCLSILLCNRAVSVHTASHHQDLMQTSVFLYLQFPCFIRIFILISSYVFLKSQFFDVFQFSVTTFYGSQL